ncbi:MAG: c-type cytochrome [Planctomycetales bacterium]|nr:c-type cytochrome [Planctomycetales bacterium]
MSRLSLCLSCLVALFATGCERAPLPEFAVSEEVEAISDEGIRERVVEILAENCGTATNVKMLGASVDEGHLERGRQVYMARCVQCHGVTGDGNGEAAPYLHPRPRDYRRGAFKFKSTNYDAKPLREDLISTVRRGIVGTSMPTFDLLPESDIEAVVDYVLALTHRGELELELSIVAMDYDDAEEFNEAISENDGELVETSIENVLLPWRDSKDEIVRPLTLMPEFSEETVTMGREAFLTKGCAKCHGTDGRGKTQDNVGTDLWGNFANAADLTSGMLHGGQRPIDVYRRIYAGIYGSPMPSFATALADEPETIWHLAHFVLDTANRRRESLPEPPKRGEAAASDSVDDTANVESDEEGVNEEVDAESSGDASDDTEAASTTDEAPQASDEAATQDEVATGDDDAADTQADSSGQLSDTDADEADGANTTAKDAAGSATAPTGDASSSGDAASDGDGDGNEDGGK